MSIQTSVIICLFRPPDDSYKQPLLLLSQVLNFKLQALALGDVSPDYIRTLNYNGISVDKLYTDAETGLASMSNPVSRIVFEMTTSLGKMDQHLHHLSDPE